MSEIPEDVPYENTLSLDELRREVRRCWDTEHEIIKALKETPAVPHWRVIHFLSRAAKFPEDAAIGKEMQREHGLDLIPPRVESELGAGLWSRIRAALVTTD